MTFVVHKGSCIGSLYSYIPDSLQTASLRANHLILSLLGSQGLGKQRHLLLEELRRVRPDPRGGTLVEAQQ